MNNAASSVASTKGGLVLLSVPSQANVPFSTNVSTVEEAKKNLTPENRSALQKYAVTLLQFPELGLDVQGYADNQPGDNQELSENRAEAIKLYISEFLEKQGASKEEVKSVVSRIFTQGNGAVQDGTTDNPNNRKAVVTLVKKDGTKFTNNNEKAEILKPYSE